MPRFVVLDFARFVLALLVATMHFDGFAASHKAYLAVDFFFILSGFVLSVAYERKAFDNNYYKSFFVDRVARLYPLHLLMLLALIPLNFLFFWTSHGQFLESGWSYQDGRVYTFLLNLFMLQNIGLNTSGSWDAPSWSISVEMFVNLFLGYLLILIARKKTIWPYLIAVSVFSYVVIFDQFGTLGAIYGRAFGFLNAGLLRGVAGISLGIVAYQLWRYLEGRTKNTTIAKYCAIITAFLCMLIILDFVRFPNEDFAIIPLMFCCECCCLGNAAPNPRWMA